MPAKPVLPRKPPECPDPAAAFARGFPRLSFRRRDLDELKHRLNRLRHETWTKASLSKWRAWLTKAEAERATCIDALALLQQYGTPQVVIDELLRFIGAHDQDIALYQDLLGHGTKDRRPWSIMARQIGPLVLAAVRNAERVTGHAPRRGYGGVDGPLINFILEELTRLCTAAGEAPPSREALHEVLSDMGGC
jgi:hypothetical protein